MRRLATLILVLAAAASVATLAFGSKAQGSSTATFDVIFDDARGLIPGQLVKVAGAKAGTITDVTVTSDFKARIQATIDSRFMPFHQDATCTIRPEGLIAENYIDCDPGTASSPPLLAQGGRPPTVPVAHTTEPVSLLDLFNIFNLPTRDRFQAIVNELGIGTAGEGDNFNDILRRANPALALARQTISILQRQHAQLATIVDATNRITTEGAGHTAALQAFLDQAAGLSSLTAAHSGSLAQAVARLPGLLGAAQPALQQLDTVAVSGTPLLNQVRAAVPALNKVSTDLGPFVRVAKPALSQLGAALRKAIPSIRDTTPLVSTLTSYTKRSLPGTLLFAKLSKNLQQHGFAENFLSVTYYIAASLARFDATSHLLSILLVGPHNGLCGNYATTPVPGCEAHYGTQAAYTPSAHRQTRARAKPSSHANTPQAASGPQAATGTPSRRKPAKPTRVLPPLTLPPIAAAPLQQTAQTLQHLVQFLLK